MYKLRQQLAGKKRGTVMPFDRIIRRNAFQLLRLTALCVLNSIFLSGCMMYPSWENDFSAMKNDAISDLVKQNAFNFSLGLKKLLDDKQLNEKASILFIGKNESDLQKLFKENGDVCDYKSTISNMKKIKCQAQRWWFLKNVGYPHFGLIKETFKYRYPGVKLVFYFSLDDSKNIQQCNVDQSDVTITKELR